MADRQVNIVISARDRASRALRRIGRQVDRFGRRVADTGALVGTAMSTIGAAAGVGIGASVRAFADFEQEMVRVQALIQPTSEQFQRLEARARELGSATTFSATQAARAMAEFSKSEFSANQILAAIVPTLELAEAGQLDIAQAASIASASMEQFGIDAAGVQNVSDQLAKGATSARTTVDELGQALSFAGGTAGQAGANITETIAALQAMAQANVTGTRAGRALRQMFLRLVAPTKEGAEAMDRLRVSVTDVDDNLRPLREIVGDLNASLEGLTKPEKVAALKNIFPAEVISGALAVLSAGQRGLGEFEAALRSANGEARRLADAFRDSTAGGFAIMQSAITEMKIEIGQELAPEMRGLADLVTESLTPAIASWATDTVEGARVVSDALKRVTGPGETLRTLFENFGSATNIGLQEVRLFAMESLDELKGFAEDVTEIPTAIQDVVTTMFSNIGTVLQNFITGFPEIGRKILVFFGDLFSKIPKLIGAALSGNLEREINKALVDISLKNLELTGQIVEDLTKGTTLITRDILPEFGDNARTSQDTLLAREAVERAREQFEADVRASQREREQREQEREGQGREREQPRRDRNGGSTDVFPFLETLTSTFNRFARQLFGQEGGDSAARGGQSGLIQSTGDSGRLAIAVTLPQAETSRFLTGVAAAAREQQTTDLRRAAESVTGAGSGGSGVQEQERRDMTSLAKAVSDIAKKLTPIAQLDDIEATTADIERSIRQSRTAKIGGLIS